MPYQHRRRPMPPATVSRASPVLNPPSARARLSSTPLLLPPTTLRALAQYRKSASATGTSVHGVDGGRPGSVGPSGPSDKHICVKDAIVEKVRSATPGVIELSEGCERLEHQTEVTLVAGGPRGVSLVVTDSDTGILVKYLILAESSHQLGLESTVSVILEHAQQLITRLSQPDQPILTGPVNLPPELLCILIQHLHEGVQPRNKSNAVRKKPFDTVTMRIQCHGASGKRQRIDKIAHPPKASVATMTKFSTCAGILWGCPVFKVNPRLCPECQYVYSRTEEHLRHRNTGHLDSKHADLWYVQGRERCRFRGGTSVDYWRWTLISIFPRYKEREAVLNPHYGTRLIEDEDDEVALRELQMRDIQESEVFRGSRQNNVESDLGRQLRDDVSGYTFSDPTSHGAPGAVPPLGPYRDPAAARRAPSGSSETSSFQQSNSVSGPSGTSVTSFTPPLDHGPTASKSLSPDGVASDQGETALPTVGGRSDYSTPPRAAWPEDVGHDSFPPPQPSLDHWLDANSAEFSNLYHSFDTQRRGMSGVYQDSAVPPCSNTEEVISDSHWSTQVLDGNDPSDNEDDDDNAAPVG